MHYPVHFFHRFQPRAAQRRKLITSPSTGAHANLPSLVLPLPLPPSQQRPASFPNSARIDSFLRTCRYFKATLTLHQRTHGRNNRCMHLKQYNLATTVSPPA